MIASRGAPVRRLAVSAGGSGLLFAGPARRGAVSAGVSALLFAGLLVWVALNHGHPLSWDGALHAAALRHRAKPLIAAARPVSVGAEVVAYPLSAAAGVLLLRPRSWWLGAVAGVGVLVLGQVLRVGLAALI